MSHPLCFFSEEQYALWLAAAKRYPPERNEHCEDCTPEYQRTMILRRRCLYPGVTFETDMEGFLRGVRPAKKYVRPAKMKSEGG